MGQNAQLYEDLVLAILAVNSYPLERVYIIKESLRREKIFSSEVAKWDHPSTISRLISAGYDRGDTMTSIFASRIQELAMFAESGGLDEPWKLVERSSREEADKLLSKIHGVGPTVLKNFWLLQEVPTP